MNIYVGKLSWDTDEDGLRDAFEAYGEVSSVKIVTDRDTGRSRGFGFVEMSEDDQGSEAIEALNGSTLDGRTIVVNEARPREDRGGRGGGGGGYNRGGGGGYGGGGGRGRY